MVSGCHTYMSWAHKHTQRETNRNRHKLDSVIIFMLAVFDFGIGICSGVNANRPFGRPPTRIELSILSVCGWDEGGELETIASSEKGSYTAKCEISEIEWQNIWGQSCCVLLQQFNMWKLYFFLYSHVPAQRAGAIVSLWILIFVFALSLHTVVARVDRKLSRHLVSHPFTQCSLSLEISCREFEFVQLYIFSCLPTSPVTFFGVWESKYGSLIIVAWVVPGDCS